MDSGQSLQAGLARGGKRPEFFDDLAFIDRTEPGKPEAPPEPLKRVRVLDPYLVSHDGTAYWPNAVAEVPESVAADWILQRWVVNDDSVESAPAETPEPRRRGRRTQ